MKKNSFFKFTSVVLVLLGFSVVTKANSRPIDELCSYLDNPTASKPVAAANVFNDDPSLRFLKAKDCPQAQLAFRSGRIWVYRIQQTKQYIIFLQDVRKNITRIAISPEGIAEVKIEQTDVVMADGVKIPTLVFRPVLPEEKAPQVVVLSRTPYLYTEVESFGGGIAAARRGETFVLQPVRGTFSAGGQFEWLDWKQEREDARSTLDWIDQQKWSNRKVVASGTSYAGFTALAAATTFHPSLIAVFATSSPWNPQTDSLSASGTYSSVAAYLFALNSGSEFTQAAFNTVSSAVSHSADIESHTRKFQNLTNFKFASLPADLNFPDNHDFIVELKKSKATMVYGFGISGDQDSRDVINLFHKIKGTPNHFFFGHNQGHNGSTLDKLYRLLLGIDNDTTEKMNATLGLMSHGQQACLFLDPSNLMAECGKDWDSLAGVVNQKIIFQDLAPKKESSVKIHEPMLVHGIKTIKIRITTPALSVPTWLNTVTYYCTVTYCEAKASIDGSLVRLKEGTHVYEIPSQHLHEEIPANGWIRLIIKILDAGKTPVANPGIKIHRTEMILPVVRVAH